MKITLFICFDMDVHKNTIMYTNNIIIKDAQITQYIQENFSTLNTDLLRFKQ